MPQLGETVTEGTITKWFKSVGDQVERDEPLFEVSTDKVDSEVPSPAEGVLTAILVEEGDTVDVGVTLATIGDGATSEGPQLPPAPSPPQSRLTVAGPPARAPGPTTDAPPRRAAQQRQSRTAAAARTRCPGPGHPGRLTGLGRGSPSAAPANGSGSGLVLSPVVRGS